MKMRQLHKTVIGMAMLLGIASPAVLRAQEAPERQSAGTPTSVEGWYCGLEGGVPFGISTFSSFGAGKARAGYTLGVYGGYRFTPELSAEIALGCGKASLSARDCCTASGYWLSSTGSTYHSSAAGECGSYYSGLESEVPLQRYGVRLNVDILGLLNPAKKGRWTLEVSPALYAVGTRSTVKATDGGGNHMGFGTRWHLGAGGNIQATYRLAGRLSVGLYTGITWLTGNGLDGIERHVHGTNLLWESGVRVGIGTVKGRSRPIETASAVPPLAEPSREVCPEKAEPPMAAEPDTVHVTAMPHPVDSLAPKAGTVVVSEELPAPAFPDIYFRFNRTDLTAGEQAKLQAILATLRANPGLRVLVTGWCDHVGSLRVNDRISRLRAEAVKRWLVGQGIDPTRINTRGNGIDYGEPDRAKARRVETETDIE